MIESRKHFQFHHIGLATHDIEASTRSLSLCDYIVAPEYPDLIVDEALGVQLRFLTSKRGGPLVELVAGLGEKSPVAQILNKGGASLYHICFEVPDVDQAFEELRPGGYKAVSKVVSAKAFEGRLIQFVYHKDTGLVELLANA